MRHAASSTDHKDRILKAAMDVLIRDGFSAVNIKSVAKELGCSTQPIAWQFGNMDNMRKALAKEPSPMQTRR